MSPEPMFRCPLCGYVDDCQCPLEDPYHDGYPDSLAEMGDLGG